MATSPKRPIRLRILGESGTTYYPNELTADFANKKISLYNDDGSKTIDFFADLFLSSSGTGNAITGLSVNGKTITITKGSTFLTAHPSITKSTDSTSTGKPAHGETFTAIDSVTRDTNGHVTKVNTKTVTLPSETDLSVETDSASTGNAVTSINVSGHKITMVKGSTFLTAHPAVTKSTDSTSTTSPAHGKTFTAIDDITRDTNGHVTKINTKTVTLPSETSLSLGTTTGSGNAVTSIAVSGHTITMTKGSTFLTAHPAVTKSTDSTSTASPALGGTFTAIDSVTRDSFGHVTKVNTKTITIPSVTIPDVSKYVKVGTETEMVDENPETLGGYTAADFVLKSEVVNVLTSTSTTLPLSAAQGKALNDKITTASSTASAALSKSGGTMTGILTAQSNTSYTTRQVRNVILSTSAPTSTDGQNGDIWLVYTA